MFGNLFNKNKPHHISASEVKGKLDAKEAFLLIDVRTREEYANGHIEGSISLPVDSIVAQISRYAKTKDTAIVVYCQSGARASRAAEELAKLGYTNIKTMGGIISWPYKVVR